MKHRVRPITRTLSIVAAVTTALLITGAALANIHKSSTAQPLMADATSTPPPLVIVSGYEFAPTPNVSQPFDSYANDSSSLPSISYDGRVVAYQSYAGNLVSGDETDGILDIYLYSEGELKDIYQWRESYNTLKVTNGATGDSSFGVVSQAIPAFDPNYGSHHLDDGRFVVYQSDHHGNSNIYSGSFFYNDPTLTEIPDNNGVTDIYLFDRIGPKRNILVSIPNDYGQGNYVLGDQPSGSWTPEMSSEIINSFHPSADVYVKHTIFNSQEYIGPMVIFESGATNLIDTPISKQHVYLRDALGVNYISEGEAPGDIILHPTTTLLSRNAIGEIGNGFHTFPSVTPDGRFLVFVSNSTNLLEAGASPAGLADNIYNIYLIDRDNDANGIFDEYSLTGGIKVYLVSREIMGNGASNGHSWYPSIALADTNTVADGIWDRVRVAFHSTASNLVTGDGNNRSDIFVYELDPNNETESLYKISISPNGDQTNHHSSGPSLSGNGRIITFTSYASNLVIGDENYNCRGSILGELYINCADIFMREIHSLSSLGPIWRVSLNKYGQQGRGNATSSSINGWGQYVTFWTESDLFNVNSEGVVMAKSAIVKRDEGTMPGNPSVQPSAGYFYGWINEPTRLTFTVSFIGPITVNGVSVSDFDSAHAGQSAYFNLVTDECSGYQWTEAGGPPGGDMDCNLVIEYTQPDRSEKLARLVLNTEMEGRARTVYVLLRGIPNTRYFPLISP